MKYKMDLGSGEFLSDNFFEAALENLPDMVHCIDHEGHIVFTNKKEVESLGYTRDELLSMSVDDIYASHRREHMHAGLEQLKEARHSEVEGVLQHKDGSHIPVEIRSIAVYDTDGNFVRTVSVLRDLRPVREAERYAAIGEVAACISHDINGLLLPIAGFAPLLIEDLKAAANDPKAVDFSQLVKYAEHVAEACEAAREFTQQVKDTGKCGTEHLDPIDLDDALKGAVALTRIRTRNAGVNANIEPSAETHIVSGNRGELLRSFTNLINNACDAMLESETRKLSISINPHSDDDNKAFWKCCFTDTGSGIPEKNLKRIFQAFFTTKSSGTGLGLAGTYQIIERHGGTINVRSKVNVGTTFEIILPQRAQSNN